jgi:hypothetical protein
LSKFSGFTGLGPLLVTKLQQTLPSRLKVFSARDLASAPANSQIVPAVHVLADGWKPNETESNPTAPLLITFRYAVVLVVRDVMSPQSAVAAHAELDVLISQVLSALHQTKLAGYGAIHCVGAQPEQYDNGSVFYPLIFECPVSYFKTT